MASSPSWPGLFRRSAHERLGRNQSTEPDHDGGADPEIVWRIIRSGDLASLKTAVTRGVCGAVCGLKESPEPR
jgi:hypothetical protein